MTDNRMTIREARNMAAASLAPLGSGRLDADVLLKWILGVDQTTLLFHADSQLTERQVAALDNAVEERRTGVELCYITGHKEFYGLDFALTRDVLPPKPDTELLVDNTIAAVSQLLSRNDQGNQVILCDMGCGCGCVGISVIHTLWKRLGGGMPVLLVMVDIMDEAILVARDNAARLLDGATLEHVSFIQGDLFEHIARNTRFDVIAANPPYIPHAEALHLLQDGRGEPLMALCGDDTRGGEITSGDGLDVMRRLVQSSVQHLKPGAALIVETGEDQTTTVEQLMMNAGFSQVEVSHDLAGMPRNVLGRLC